MEQLITFLQNIPEYKVLLQSLQKKQTAAVTGVGQINRSHLIAGLCCELRQPVVMLCQDDGAS